MSPAVIKEWLALLTPAFIIIGASGFAVYQGWTRASKAVAVAPNTLIAGDIMSTKPMADLAIAVSDLARNVDDMVASQDRSAEASNRVCAAVDRMESAVRDMIRATERRAGSV